MKKYFIVLPLFLLIVSCGEKSELQKTTKAKESSLNFSGVYKFKHPKFPELTKSRYFFYITSGKNLFGIDLTEPGRAEVFHRGEIKEIFYDEKSKKVRAEKFEGIKISQSDKNIDSRLLNLLGVNNEIQKLEKSLNSKVKVSVNLTSLDFSGEDVEYLKSLNAHPKMFSSKLKSLGITKIVIEDRTVQKKITYQKLLNTLTIGKNSEKFSFKSLDLLANGSEEERFAVEEDLIESTKLMMNSFIKKTLFGQTWRDWFDASVECIQDPEQSENVDLCIVLYSIPSSAEISFDERMNALSELFSENRCSLLSWKSVMEKSDLFFENDYPKNILWNERKFRSLKLKDLLANIELIDVLVDQKIPVLRVEDDLENRSLSFIPELGENKELKGLLNYFKEQKKDGPFSYACVIDFSEIN